SIRINKLIQIKDHSAHLRQRVAADHFWNGAWRFGGKARRLVLKKRVHGFSFRSRGWPGKRESKGSLDLPIGIVADFALETLREMRRLLLHKIAVEEIERLRSDRGDETPVGGTGGIA